MEIKVPNELSGLVQLASDSDATVLITGPTGCGKSELARFIHGRSSRRDRPWITVNLASLHEGTFESELFGHEKGAFTSADQKRRGRLELAQGGTVFFDEIGDLSIRMQARLLEFLQSRTITPLGGGREIRLDVRIIAATHRNLEQDVKDGRFREDLFHRFRVIAMELRSLAERWDDFDELIHLTLGEISNQYKKRIHQISEEVALQFERYHWPGNIRELRNVIEYGVIACKDSILLPEHLPKWFCDSAVQHSDLAHQLGSGRGGILGIAQVPLTLDFHESLIQFEKEYLRRALQRFEGKINRTAREIGLSKATVIRRSRSHRIKVEKRSPQD